MNQEDIDNIARALQKLSASGASAASDSSSEAVKAVSLKLPAFWTAKPELWFKQVEAQFATRAISVDSTKFNYVVQSLDNNTAAEVEHIIMSPPATGSYAAIKAALINSYGISEEKKADSLLNMGGLGDRKPTSLLRHMKSLNPDQETLFRCLFMSKLPHEVQTVLSASSEKDVDKLAEMADKMVENSSMRHSNLAAPPPPLGVAAASRPVGQTKKAPSPSHHTTPKASNSDTPGPCFYHAKYGDKATKCPKRSCPYHRTFHVASAQAGESTLDPNAENFQASR